MTAKEQGLPGLKALAEVVRRFEATIPTPSNHRGESTMRIGISLTWCMRPSRNSPPSAPSLRCRVADVNNFHVEVFDERGVSVLPKGITVALYTDIDNVSREADASAAQLCTTRPSYVVAQEFTDVNPRS